MRILIVSESDGNNGGYAAAIRLYDGLRKQGVHAKMLVQNKTTHDSNIICTPSLIKKIYTFLRIKLSYRLVKLEKTNNPILHSLNLFPSGLHKEINRMNVDLVNLHWINREMISIKEISKINKPIVWTLHDSWAFCGTEHHPPINTNVNHRYEYGYYKNNRYFGYCGFDLSRAVWFLKRKYWKNKSINIVTPSKWLYECASKSILFKNNKIYRISNGLDTDQFQRRKNSSIRKRLKISPNKKLILFIGDMQSQAKGFNLLKKALSHLSDQYSLHDIELLIVGSNKTDDISIKGIRCQHYGFVDNNELLAQIYSSADVLVLPSLIENLSYTLIEANACGIPAVAFNVGGNSQIIEHKITGYLARAYNHKDLANGIKWVLNDPGYNKLCKKARDKVIKEYGSILVAKKYIKVYNQIIQE